MDFKEHNLIEVSNFKVKESGRLDAPVLLIKETPRVVRDDILGVLGHPEQYLGEASEEQQDQNVSKARKPKVIGPVPVSVKELKPEMGIEWQIRCSVNKKHPVKTHAKGKLFKVDLVDDLDRETMIEGTFYTEETDLFVNKIFEGRTYRISKAEISVANKKFTTIKHEFRLIFKPDTLIEEV